MATHSKNHRHPSSSKPMLNVQRHGDKPSTYHEQPHRNGSRTIIAAQPEQNTAKKREKGVDLPFQQPNRHPLSEKSSMLPSSNSQASLSGRSHTESRASDRKHITSSNTRESPLVHPTSLEGTTPLSGSTESFPSTQEPQVVKEPNLFSLFSPDPEEPSELVPPNEIVGHGASTENIVHGDTEFVEIRQLRESDTLIALMGPTGAGKSSFISKAANRDIGVGHDLQSETRDVKAIRIRVPGENKDIVLVDTPGFDDTHKSDHDILQIISKWLKETGSKNIRLAGVLYLHRISDNRMAGTPLRNLELFEKICGPGWFHRVVLVTTMWGELMEPLEGERHEGERREEELCTTFWAPMLSQGSRTERHDDSHESAWRILKSIMNSLSKEKEEPKRTDKKKEPKRTDKKINPRLQREMADKGRALAKTDAGQELYGQMNELERQRKGLIRKLDKQIRKVEEDEEVKAILQGQRDQLKEESQAAEGDLKQLKVGVSRRLLKSLGMGASKASKWVFSS